MASDLSSIEDLYGEEAAAKEDTSQGKLTKGIQDIQLKELEDTTSAHAAANGFSYINLVGYPIMAEALSMLSEEEARTLKAVVFFADSEHLRIAALDPSNPEVQAKAKDLLERYFFKSGQVYQISTNSLNYGFKMYATLPKLRVIKWGVDITEKDLLRFQAEINNIVELREKINKVNISDVITLVIAGALRMESSDIHIEAGEASIEVRYRVDGVLQSAANIEIKRWREVISRLKVLAKVKINISDKPQDGRFTIFLTENKIDVRVSFLPTAYGESVVIRILEANVEGLVVEALGMQSQAKERLMTEISKPNGMILTTGPTGSGKTTTLYAVLNRLNKPGIKIITLEDPIEYHLKGINQSQVDESKGYTFAKGLRSILRQDPDILMVGEIRDIETAEIAIQASLTGHLVLSTLHTNDASGVIPRLLDLGVKPFLLTPSLNAVMAQRLVRKLCPACKVVHQLEEPEVEQLRKILAVISPKTNINIPSVLPTIYKEGDNKKCTFCHGIGYKGRLGIYEIFSMTDEIKELTAASAPAFKILEKAIEAGMLTMLQDGVLKALDGITSLEEVYDVIGKMDYVDALYDIVMSKTIGRGIKIKAEHLTTAEKIAAKITGAEDLIVNTPTSELINVIVAAAIKAEAGDIHVDPQDKGVRIRFRVDGILHDVATLPSSYYIPLIGEIKNLIGFELNEKLSTYEGRFSIYLPDESRMDCRVSIITGGYGETAVMRILSKQASALAVEDLGIRNRTLDQILEATTKTKGIIINTGPTGSGKTTTLYSLLNRLNRPDLKIITIEDPIEYNLSGIMQTQIDEKGGYTFANALRSLMRQNPNILMIGEVRDEETAKAAIEASLSGHLVLSTVHANSAASAIGRFRELGVERSFLASSVEISIGQRLVRRICTHCKAEYTPTAEELTEVTKTLALIKPVSGLTAPAKLEFYHGLGCEFCGGLGYKGRIGLYEAITMSPELKKLVLDINTTDDEMEALALDQGFIPMALDGVLKALSGETTLEEVFRVAK
ncbi:MAG: GspE/PulE family protein [Candidatus Falkowbacteria bacterium]